MNGHNAYQVCAALAPILACAFGITWALISEHDARAYRKEQRAPPAPAAEEEPKIIVKELIIEPERQRRQPKG